MLQLRTLGSKIWNAVPGTAEFNDLLKYDRMSVEQWLDEEAVGMPYPEHAKQAVRDWCYQGENFPQRPEHLWYEFLLHLGFFCNCANTLSATCRRTSWLV